MNEIVEANRANKIEIANNRPAGIELSGLLADTRTEFDGKSVTTIPIAELAALGAGVSSLVPAFRTVTQTTSVAVDGVFRIANAVTGDTLKLAQNGNAWGALKTAAGKSKMAQLTKVENLSAVTQTVAAFNPATVLMAAALYSMEKDLKKITATQQEILSFLEVENESQIEADVGSLVDVVTNYKYNWDNELSMASSHKLVMDIQNRARKNMLAYQKKVLNAISAKKPAITQSKMAAEQTDLEKKFKYYRLSVYNFSLASMMKIMLSGNFKEAYITKIQNEIESLAISYRELFQKGSLYLEKLGNVGIEANVIKGLGTAEKTVGKFIGAIPMIKEGPVDEFLQDKGETLQKSAADKERKALEMFASLGNPGIRVFIEKMEDMIHIYNHTSGIYCDKDNIYLVG